VNQVSQSPNSKPIAVPPQAGQTEIPPDNDPRKQQQQQQQVPRFATDIIQALPVPPPPVINGKPVRLAIGIPISSQVDSRWMLAFSNLRQVFPTATIIFDNKYGIAQSREAILNQFNALADLTHLLFFDTDILPQPYGLYTLLQDTALPDVDFVSGFYWNSLFTGNNGWIDEKPLDMRQFNEQNMPQSPLIKVDKFGMGFCVITKELMKKLLVVDRPLFYYKISDGALHSEDFYFQATLKKMGIPIFMDYRVQCAHLKTAIIQSNFAINF
jgi:hypothetical protein